MIVQSGSRKNVAIPTTTLTIPSVKNSLSQCVSISRQNVDLSRIPLPTGQSSRCDTVESKGQYSANNSTEVSECSDIEDTLCKFVGSIPITHLKKHSGPQASFEKPEEETSCPKTFFIFDGSVAAQRCSPSHLS